MTVLADPSQIEKYIPQRNPMIMIHNLVEATEHHAVSEFFIEENNIFIEGDVFREVGLIENIAQTAAAHAGYMYKQKGLEVPLGFIAAIKDLQIIELPGVNSKVITTIKITNTVFNVTIIKARVQQAGKILCNCEMKIFTKS